MRRWIVRDIWRLRDALLTLACKVDANESLALAESNAERARLNLREIRERVAARGLR